MEWGGCVSGREAAAEVGKGRAAAAAAAGALWCACPRTPGGPGGQCAAASRRSTSWRARRSATPGSSPPPCTGSPQSAPAGARRALRPRRRSSSEQGAQPRRLHLSESLLGAHRPNGRVDVVLLVPHAQRVQHRRVAHLREQSWWVERRDARQGCDRLAALTSSSVTRSSTPKSRWSPPCALCSLANSSSVTVTPVGTFFGACRRCSVTFPPERSVTAASTQRSVSSTCSHTCSRLLERAEVPLVVRELFAPGFAASSADASAIIFALEGAFAPDADRSRPAIAVWRPRCGGVKAQRLRAQDCSSSAMPAHRCE